MQTLSEIRTILADRGLHPKKALGQNFLHDQNQLRRLLEASGVGEGDLVLEVGPGTGTLTESLLDRGCEVVACELDRDLAAILEERLGDRITLVRTDCLDDHRTLAGTLEDALSGRPFTLVSNLPYGAASPLMCLLAAREECQGQHVTIQREVADRLLAGPGTKAYGSLSIFVAALASVRKVGILPPGCFWPPPKVDSAIVSIMPHEKPMVDDPEAFGRFLQGIFSRRRKQLGTIIGRDAPLPDGVSGTMRPEELSVESFVALHALNG
jgi:16S rRNA (adenine1518-N6/adenine1519-N6)-dimethyltransferase